MDNAAFDRWTEALETLRRSRHEEVERSLQERADSFKPAEFYQLALRSLEAVLEQWYAMEQESWSTAAPAPIAKALQTVKSELGSIYEFEMESIERETTFITTRITWLPDEFEDARKNFLPLADEIHKKYQIKLKSLTPAEVKNPLPFEPSRTVQYSGSASGGGGMSSVIMLVVGLLLGGGISIYFKDSQRKSESHCEEEKAKLLATQRELADSMALLHSNFSDLVRGKSQPIPQLEVEAARLQRILDGKVDNLNAEASGVRSRLVQKIPAGDRLDRALDEVERDRKRRVQKVEEDYRPSLRVLEKRILLYKDLLGEAPRKPS